MPPNWEIPFLLFVSECLLHYLLCFPFAHTLFSMQQYGGYGGYGMGVSVFKLHAVLNEFLEIF